MKMKIKYLVCTVLYILVHLNISLASKDCTQFRNDSLECFFKFLKKEISCKIFDITIDDEDNLNGTMFCQSYFSSSGFNKLFNITLGKKEIGEFEYSEYKVDIYDKLEFFKDDKSYERCNLYDLCGYKSAFIRNNRIEYYLSNILNTSNNALNDEEKKYNPPELVEKIKNLDCHLEMCYVELFEEDAKGNRKYGNAVESITAHLLAFTNTLINEIAVTYYFNDPYLKNINEQYINNLKVTFKKYYDLYTNYYGKSVDFYKYNGAYTDSFYDYVNESQSPLYRSKFYKALNDLIFIVNKEDGELNCGLGLHIDGNKFSLDINPSSIFVGYPDLDEVIDMLCDKIDNLSDSYHDSMNKVYLLLDEVYSSYLNEINKFYVFYDNYQLVIRLYYTVKAYVFKEKRDYYLSERKRLNSGKKLSETKLTFESLFYVPTNDIKSMFTKENLSNPVLPYLIKGIEAYAINYEDSYIDENTINILSSILKLIKDKQNDISKSGDNMLYLRRSEIDQFLELVANYNDMISNINVYSKINIDNAAFSAFIIDKTVDENVRYLYTKEINDAINDIIMNDSEMFEKHKNKRFAIEDKNRCYSHYDLGKKICEFNIEYLKYILDDDDLTCREQAMNMFYDIADNHHKMILTRAYNTKFTLIRCEPPTRINDDDAADVIFNNGIISVNEKYVNNIWNTMYDLYYNFIVEISKFDDNAITDGYELNDSNDKLIINSIYEEVSDYREIYSSIYKKITSMKDNNKLDKETLKNFDRAIYFLNTFVQTTRYMFSQLAGRDNNEIFNKVKNEYDKMTSNCMLISNLNSDLGNPSVVYDFVDGKTDYIVNNLNEIEYKLVRKTSNPISNDDIREKLSINSSSGQRLSDRITTPKKKPRTTTKKTNTHVKTKK